MNKKNTNTSNEELEDELEVFDEEDEEEDVDDDDFDFDDDEDDDDFDDEDDEELEALFDEIDDLIDSNNVVLFMKGTPKLPMCHFSGKVCNILKECGVTNFHSVNVLENDAMREAIKEYSDWPSLPQLYIAGEFIGGCDIVSEMFESGELQTLLAENK